MAAPHTAIPISAGSPAPAARTADSKTPLLQGVPLPQTSTEEWSAWIYWFLSSFGTHGFLGIVTAWGVLFIGKTVIILAVIAIIALQVLAYKGFIHISWSDWRARVQKSLDIDHDGDIDIEDAKVWGTKIWKYIAGQGLPATLGFVLGFFLGWRILG